MEEAENGQDGEQGMNVPSLAQREHIHLPFSRLTNRHNLPNLPHLKLHVFPPVFLWPSIWFLFSSCGEAAKIPAAALCWTQGSTQPQFCTILCFLASCLNTNILSLQDGSFWDCCVHDDLCFYIYVSHIFTSYIFSGFYISHHPNYVFTSFSPYISHTWTIFSPWGSFLPSSYISLFWLLSHAVTSWAYQIQLPFSTSPIVNCFIRKN